MSEEYIAANIGFTTAKNADRFVRTVPLDQTV